MFSKILHANDGSEHAFHALALALTLAKQNSSELHMVVRFCAAGVAIADIARPDRVEPICEYRELNQNSATAETSPRARC
jgi:nucleotide-binding universal stress UspA family protein